MYNSVTIKYWVTLEFLRRHGNLKPKRFDFCIEYKPVKRTFIINDWNYLVFWKKLTLNQVFLKCFSIHTYIHRYIDITFVKYAVNV